MSELRRSLRIHYQSLIAQVPEEIQRQEVNPTIKKRKMKKVISVKSKVVKKGTKVRKGKSKENQSKLLPKKKSKREQKRFIKTNAKNIPPLNNDTIENIVSFLNVESLKRIRLVSTQWNEMSLKRLGKLTFLKERRPFERNRNKMIKIVENSNPLLFINWKLDMSTFELEQMESLIQTCGPQLKAIFIDRIPINLEHFYSIHRIISELCPNLKNLSLRIFRDKIVDKRRFPGDLIPTFDPNVLKNIDQINIAGQLDDLSSQFIMNIMKSCPKLDKIGIKLLLGSDFRHQLDQQDLIDLTDEEKGMHWEERIPYGVDLLKMLARRPDIYNRLTEFSLEQSSNRFLKKSEQIFKEGVAYFKIGSKVRTVGYCFKCQESIQPNHPFGKVLLKLASCLKC